MNKEDILMLVDYLSDKELNKEMNYLKDKLDLIKKQIEAQDIIADVQKKLQELDK